MLRAGERIDMVDKSPCANILPMNRTGTCPARVQLQWASHAAASVNESEQTGTYDMVDEALSTAFASPSKPSSAKYFFVPVSSKFGRPGEIQLTSSPGNTPGAR